MSALIDNLRTGLSQIITDNSALDFLRDKKLYEKVDLSKLKSFENEDDAKKLSADEIFEIIEILGEELNSNKSLTAEDQEKLESIIEDLLDAIDPEEGQPITLEQETKITDSTKRKNDLLMLKSDGSDKKIDDSKSKDYLDNPDNKNKIVNIFSSLTFSEQASILEYYGGPDGDPEMFKRLIPVVAKGKKEDLEDLIIDAASGENQELVNKIISGIGGMETGGYEFIRDMFKEPNGLLVLSEDSVNTKEKEKIFLALVEFGNKEDSGDNQWRRHALLHGIDQNPALKTAIMRGQTGLKNAWDANGNLKNPAPADGDLDKYFDMPPVLASMFAVHLSESDGIKMEQQLKKDEQAERKPDAVNAANSIRDKLINGESWENVAPLIKDFYNSHTGPENFDAINDFYKIIMNSDFLETIPENQQQALFQAMANGAGQADGAHKETNIRLFIETMVAEGAKNFDKDPNNDAPFFIDLDNPDNKALRDAMVKYAGANGNFDGQRAAQDDAIKFYEDTDFDGNNQLKHFWDDNKHNRDHHFYNNNRIGGRKDDKYGGVKVQFGEKITGLSEAHAKKFKDFKNGNIYGDFNGFLGTLNSLNMDGGTVDKSVDNNRLIMLSISDALTHSTRNDDEKKNLLSNLLEYISGAPNDFPYMGAMTRSHILKELIKRNPDFKKDLAELATASPKNNEIQAFNTAVQNDAWEFPKISPETANAIAGAWIDGVAETTRTRPTLDEATSQDAQAQVDAFYRNDLVFNLRQSDDLATKIFDSTGKLKLSELNKLKEQSGGKEVTGAAALAQKMINLNVTDIEEIKIVLGDLPKKEQNKFLSVMMTQLPPTTVEAGFPLFINTFLDNNPKDEELKALFTDIQASPNKDIVLEAINAVMPDDKKYTSLTDTKFLTDIVKSTSDVRQALLTLRPSDMEASTANENTPEDDNRGTEYNNLKSFINEKSADDLTDTNIKELLNKATTTEQKETLIKDIVDGQLLANLMDDPNNKEDIKKAEKLIGTVFTWIKEAGDNPNLRKTFLKAVDEDSVMHKTIKGLGTKYTKLADSITGEDKDGKTVSIDSLKNEEMDVLFNTMPKDFVKEFTEQQGLVKNKDSGGAEYIKLKTLVNDTPVRDLTPDNIQKIFKSAETDSQKENLIDDIINQNLIPELLDDPAKKDDIKKAEMLMQEAFKWIESNKTKPDLRKAFIKNIDKGSGFYKTLGALGYDKLVGAIDKPELRDKLTDEELSKLFKTDGKAFVTELQKYATEMMAVSKASNETAKGAEVKELEDKIKNTKPEDLKEEDIITILNKAETDGKKQALIDNIMNKGLLIELLDNPDNKDDIAKAKILLGAVFAWVKGNNLRKMFIDKIDDNEEFHEALKGLGTEYKKISDAIKDGATTLTDAEMDVLFNTPPDKLINELLKKVKKDDDDNDDDDKDRSRNKGSDNGDITNFYQDILLSDKDKDDDDFDMEKVFDSKGIIKRKYIKNAGGASGLASAMMDRSPPLTSPEDIAEVLGDLSPKKDQAAFIETMMTDLPSEDLEPILPLFMGQLLMQNAGGDVSTSDLKSLLKKVNGSDNADVVLDYLNENLEDEADSLTDASLLKEILKPKSEARTAIMDEWADIVIEYSDEDEETIEKIKEKVINSKGKASSSGGAEGEPEIDPVTGQPIAGGYPMALPPFNMFAPTPLSMAAHSMSQDTINMCMGAPAIPFGMGGINIQAGGDVTINIGNVGTSSAMGGDDE